MVSNSSQIPSSNLNFPSSIAHLSSIQKSALSIADSPESKFENSSDSSTKSVHECRICYQQISPVVSRQHPQSHRSLLLKNPCACKGSLSYVHEACLVKWLVQRGARRCELCHTNFVIKEEYGTIPEMIKQTIGYIFSSNRRLLKVTIYAIYLYLFFKRFAFVVKYFKSLVTEFLLSTWRNFKLPAGLNSAKLRTKIDYSGSLTKKQILSFIYNRLIQSVMFLYNTFILVQLCCIGYAESYRVKAMLGLMMNNIKRLRVIDQSNRPQHQPLQNLAQPEISDNSSDASSQNSR